jgi:hypothetical protein
MNSREELLALADWIDGVRGAPASVDDLVRWSGLARSLANGVSAQRPLPDPDKVAAAIYTAPGLYLSPADSKKAAIAAIEAMSSQCAHIQELETQLAQALAGEATWKACAEGWQERADASTVTSTDHCKDSK